MKRAPYIRSSCVAPLRESPTVTWLFREQDAERARRAETRLQTETHFRAPVLTDTTRERDEKRAVYEQNVVDQVKTISFFRSRATTR